MAELRQRAVDIPQEFSQVFQKVDFPQASTLLTILSFQLHNAYTSFVESANGLVIIDQQIAHERILYEQYKNNSA